LNLILPVALQIRHSHCGAGSYLMWGRRSCGGGGRQGKRASGFAGASGGASGGRLCRPERGGLGGRARGWAEGTARGPPKGEGGAKRAEGWPERERPPARDVGPALLRRRKKTRAGARV